MKTNNDDTAYIILKHAQDDTVTIERLFRAEDDAIKHGDSLARAVKANTRRDGKTDTGMRLAEWRDVWGNLWYSLQERSLF